MRQKITSTNVGTHYYQLARGENENNNINWKIVFCGWYKNFWSSGKFILNISVLLYLYACMSFLSLKCSRA